MDEVKYNTLREMYEINIKYEATGVIAKMIEEVIHQCLPDPDTYYDCEGNPEDDNAWKWYMDMLIAEGYEAAKNAGHLHGASE